jgi:hypothetical protein
VLGVDRDASRLARGRERAAAAGLAVEWRELDLQGAWPGGLLMMETFLDAQRDAGWGPTSEEHLLRPGELARLVAPLTIVHGREVLETVDSNRWRAVASIVARNSKR